MTRSAENAPPLAPGLPAWQRCLGPGAEDNPLYHEAFNGTLCTILQRAPGRVLELGCAGGRLGAHLKSLHPDARVTGIEMSAAAAAIARTRLDKVIERRLEDIDFGAEGIAPGSIDTFIAGDVLEHMVDPWHALVRILPLLSPDAQVAVSVPNVRNLRVHAQLHNQGSWRYDTHGLLDITHLRFFAMQDAVRMLDETGYAVQDVKGTVDPELAELFRANAGKSSVSVQAGRLRLDNLTQAELQEYCTLQWVLLATPKPAAANDPLAA